MKKSLILLAVLVSCAFVSCDKDEVDNTAPIISLVQPVTESMYEFGDTVPFECNFSDETELNSYKVEVHFGEEHEHKGIASDDAKSTGEEWTYTYNGNFNAGETQTTIVLNDIIIPDSVEHEGVMELTLEGEYHVGVYCTDEAGNQTEHFTTIDVEAYDH